MPEETTPIPEPPGLPFIGNVHEIDSEYPLGSIIHLADQYGEIYRLHLAGRTIVIASTNALVNELCDEKRFVKGVNPVLAQVRNGVHDGLFTAAENEQNWGIAHRVLMPAFGPMSIRGMFDEMYDIGSQLALKWSRHGPDVPIMVTDDFTRLALDTIALCSMNYRFNSYYHDEMHPFIEAMGSFLKECGSRSRRIGFTEVFYRQANQKYWADIEVLRKTADGVLKARKEHPSDRKDLLGAMLEGVDPKTGERMSDASIIDNLITFLIAGHETTSGMLSFAFYQLLKHPEAYRKAQQEVDDVVGTGPIAVEHLPKLHYIQAILRETLRLSATIPQIAVQAREDTLLAGKYAVPKGEFISLLLAKAQTDPVVFGDDANEFVPERMLDENFERLNREFPNCWKPFGNGLRACIGRPFAWQEATMVTAMLLQNFNFLLDDPSYHLTIKQTLTIKPKDFYMRAVLRDGLTPTMLEQRLHRKSSKDSPAPPKNSVGVGTNARPGTGGAKGKPMSIYYGSNSGTCESLAQRLASDASAHGFRASVVHSLDAANQKLPQDQPVVIITASYEGQPPDNAAHFVAWLQSLKGAEMENVSYAVFGCGHHDWSQTFHRIPKLVDATIEKLGGSRLVPMGLADAGEGDLFTEFETWEDEIFWPAIAKKYGAADAAGVDAVTPGLTVEITTPRSSTLRQDVREAVVIANKDITAEGAPLKKHIEIQLPSDVQYSSGDYLAILPLNPNEIVSRALRKFQIAWDAFVTITAEGHTTLPTNTAISAHDVLSAYVELAQPATKRNVLTLAEAAKDDATKSQLKALATDAYSTEISAKRVSILDLLERFPAVALPFGTFLSLLPPMRVRQYSISSSPLWNPSRVTLTYAVLDAPALSGSTHRHVGVASSYLASLAPGDKLHVAVRPSHVAFHLPVDAEHTPVICVAAGTGLAPFRGFVQERAAMIGAGRSVAPAMLFFGCRDPELDDLYRDELDRWAKMGAVDVRRAYSRKAGVPEAKGCRYVQERLWEDRLDVDELWGRGAKVYVCGSRDVGENVKQVALKMRKTAEREKKGEEMNDEEAVKWFDGIRNERYATDVFD